MEKEEKENRIILAQHCIFCSWIQMLDSILMSWIDTPMMKINILILCLVPAGCEDERERGELRIKRREDLEFEKEGEVILDNRASLK